MFFSDDLLTGKKGSLGIVWLMATLGPRNKRVTRKALTGVEIPRACRYIMEPPEPMALRLSGHLLVGVARVYNQTYDIFYSDVQTFHSALRRSIVTDFAVAGGGTAKTDGIDLPGGGRSRPDQITFGGLNDMWGPLDPTMNLFNIDFENLDAHLRDHRQESKLASLPSIKSAESQQDDEDTEEHRKTRHVTPSRINLTPRESFTNPDRSGGRGKGRALHQAFKDLEGENNFDGVNLGIFDPLPDEEPVSDRSGVGFVLPDEFVPDPFINGEEVPFPCDPSSLPLPSSQTGDGDPVDGAKRPRSASVIDGSEAPLLKKKTKKRALKFDDNLEETASADRDKWSDYSDEMDRQRQLAVSKDQQKATDARAAALVDGAGLLFTFFDDDMQETFATLAKAPQYQWEQEIAANRAGQQHDIRPPAEYDGQGTVDHIYGEMTGATEHETYVPDDLEGIRRISQSNQSMLPWQDISHSDFGGGASDAGLTPGRLSIVTPQEVQLRKARESSVTSVLGARVGREGSAMSESHMLAPPLVDDDLVVDRTPSRHQSAFSPQMLAALDMQCRNFFTYVELKINESGFGEVDFEELAPVRLPSFTPTGGKRIAATAFYNCLTLVTKRILSVEQNRPWASITVKINAP
ncbi:R8 protein [Cryptotrichosporon argae]